MGRISKVKINHKNQMAHEALSEALLFCAVYSISQMGSSMYIQFSDFVGKILKTFENRTYKAELTISLLILFRSLL